MIIAATAHPGKFADVMLRTLGQEWAGNLKPSEILRSLTNMAPLPEMHMSLQETLRISESKERLQCKNSYASMVEEVGRLALAVN